MVIAPANSREPEIALTSAVIEAPGWPSPHTGSPRALRHDVHLSTPPVRPAQTRRKGALVGTRALLATNCKASTLACQCKSGNPGFGPNEPLAWRNACWGASGAPPRTISWLRSVSQLLLTDKMYDLGFS